MDQQNPEDPVLSPSFFPKKIFPQISATRPLFFILIDNMRFDQWKMISAELSGLFRVVEEDIYFSILPTVTQYSRNAIFRRADAIADRGNNASVLDKRR